MKLFNWTESFEQQPVCEDIPQKIQKLERTYWIWLLLSCFVVVAGIVIILTAPVNDLKWHALGVILAIDGCFSVGVLKLWAHTWLAAYRIMWDNMNRLNAELRKSEAQDI